jgi:hypothetical protein
LNIAAGNDGFRLVGFVLQPVWFAPRSAEENGAGSETASTESAWSENRLRRKWRSWTATEKAAAASSSSEATTAQRDESRIFRFHWYGRHPENY